MKLFITLLTHHNLPSLKRLVNSVENQYPESYLDVETVIVVNTLSDDYYQSVLNENFSLKVIRTESNGKCGLGKNSCRDLFLKSDADFLSQIDGDDIIYPTFLQSIAQHIKHYPNIDALGIAPSELLATYDTGGHSFRCGENDEFWGCVWGISLVKRPDHGPGRGSWIDHPKPEGFDRIILQSKLSAVIRMDEDITIGDDFIYSYQLLAEHQKRNLRYFITMSSDLYVTDRTFTNTIIHEYGHLPYAEEMKTKAMQHVNINRSSLEELPVIFNDLLITHQEKAEFLKKIF